MEDQKLSASGGQSTDQLNPNEVDLDTYKAFDAYASCSYSGGFNPACPNGGCDQ